MIYSDDYVIRFADSISPSGIRSDLIGIYIYIHVSPIDSRSFEFLIKDIYLSIYLFNV